MIEALTPGIILVKVALAERTALTNWGTDAAGRPALKAAEATSAGRKMAAFALRMVTKMTAPTEAPKALERRAGVLSEDFQVTDEEDRRKYLAEMICPVASPTRVLGTAN